MASEAAPSTVNGTFHAHHHAGHYPADPYNQSHAANNSVSAHYNPSQHMNSFPAHGHESKNDITKDEVGWYFVEQYYTTLSRNPEKLHLFYSRKSQFVSGAEAEKVTVAVGQKAIHERIKQLEFQDCKVRVLNVDSQASFDNIVVCVIGEISNKSEPPRRFVQTFVLAEQPNGYYVLNDIIRYLVEEDEELVAGEAPVEEAPVVADTAAVTATEEAPQAEEEHQADSEVAAQQVDEKLEEATTNGDAKSVSAEEQPQPQPEEQKAEAQTPAPSAPVPIIPATADAVVTEKPKTPEPSPAPARSPAKSATSVVDKENIPPAKMAPMSWASVASARAAAAAPAPAAVPAAAAPPPQKAAPAPAQAPAQAPAEAPQQPAAPSASSANEVEKVPSQSSSSNGEWQTADHKRQGRQQGAAVEDNTLAFVKNVNDKVDASLLRQTLQRFGKLKYFNVNRQQGCAFVEFENSAGYKAAVGANPHQIGTERIVVEERRPRGNAYGGNTGYTAGRGGAGRGRGDRAASQGRGGFPKEAGRYPPRGRGGNITPKGRSQPQAS